LQVQFVDVFVDFALLCFGDNNASIDYSGLGLDCFSKLSHRLGPASISIHSPGFASDNSSILDNAGSLFKDYCMACCLKILIKSPWPANTTGAALYMVTMTGKYNEELTNELALSKLVDDYSVEHPPRTRDRIRDGKRITRSIISFKCDN
jgi:hypothetical protein